MGGGGSGGGAVSYKEPPQSRLKKLWATDPLEQNSKPGTEEPLFVFVTVHAVASDWPADISHQSCLYIDCLYRRVNHVHTIM